MPVFPSEEWVRAWTDRANADSDFVAAAQGWQGALGLVVSGVPSQDRRVDTFIRLDGAHGLWTGFIVGGDRGTVTGTVFCLRAGYDQWKQLVRGELDPIKGIVQGKVALRGHLPEVLRWTGAVLRMAEIAGALDTQFPDEPARPPNDDWL